MSSTITIPVGWSRPAGRLVHLGIITVGIGLLVVSAKVKVPFWPVPVTLQTLAVPLLAHMLGARLGVATVLAYLSLGLAGWPVFTNTPPALAGPSYFVGPTAGYLVAMPVVALGVGRVAELSQRLPILATAAIAGNIFVLMVGGVWLALGAQIAAGRVGLGLEQAWAVGVVPFVLADIVKALLAAALAHAATHQLKSQMRGNDS